MGSVRRVKFIQINIYRGEYLDNLLEFLKQEAPDFVAAQEVTCGVTNNYRDKSADLFELVKKELNYNGVFATDVEFADYDRSWIGNAVFSKFPIVNNRIFALKDFRKVTKEEFEKRTDLWPLASRHIVDAVCDMGGFRVHALSLHGAWTAPPYETEEKTRQARLVFDYLDNLNRKDEPFVLGTDLNMPPETNVARIISAACNNLMDDSGFTYTTHPKIHKIVPRKILVDYIFTSKHFRLRKLDVPEIIVSDHLPVVAELELEN